jgi:hypothetical protein
MSNTIQIKRSSTAASVPTAGQLAVGELAVNLADRKLFTKNASNVVVPVTNAPDSGFGFRNRIINGDMRVSQRGTSGSDGGYTVDRFRYSASLAGKATWAQNQGSVTPPAGFQNYLGFTSSSAYSVGASERFSVEQYIEGFNVADLAWGTANAQSITISFWVRSSLTGTFGASIQNSAINRSYPFNYIVSAANTWEQKTVVVPGDTTGTWLTGNGAGLLLMFGLGVGSTLSGTAGSWSGSNFQSATGAVSVVGTSGATFYITGVQLEAGSVATPFERRPYGTELALCQRYYQFVGGNASAGYPVIRGYVTSTGSIGTNVCFPVEMRAIPTLTRNGTWNVTLTGQPTASNATTKGFELFADATGTGTAIVFPGATSATVTISAEL